MPRPPAAEKSPSRFTQRNQAVERALHVLELLSAGEAALSLQEISRRLGLHPSTTHRILKTLEEQAYLSRLEGTERYRLGPNVLTLAARMLNNLPVREVAAPYLRRLSVELGQSVALASYEYGYSVYLDCAEGPASIGVFLRPGGRAPAPCVASGRALLAFQPEAEIRRVLDSGLAECANGQPLPPEAVRADLEHIRRQGYALDDNSVPGLRAAAAPILDAAQTAVAAITVLGLAGNLPLEQLPHMGARVRATASLVSAQLGYVAPLTATS